MTGQDTGDEEVERVAGWWVLCAVLGPFGFGTPAGFAYAAHRSGTRRWYAWAAIWGALTTIGIVLAALAPREGAQFMLGALIIYGTWLTSTMPRWRRWRSFPASTPSWRGAWSPRAKR